MNKINIIDDFPQENKTVFVIYLLRNIINNKIYIGQTTNLKSRLNKHKNSKKDWGQIISKSINKYGYKNFQCEILYYADTLEELNIKECSYIKSYDCTNKQIGYNIEFGGKNSKMSELTKDKLRQINLNKVVSIDVIEKIRQSTTGENNHFFGKNHTNKTKLKMIKSWETREKVSDETKERMSQSQIGREHSKETKQKISNSHLGIRSHETPVYILNEKLEIIYNCKNIEESSKIVNCSKRNVYDAVNNLRFVKRKYWIIRQENYETDITKIKIKFH